MARTPHPSTEEVPTWLAEALPTKWFVEAPEVRIDKDEIVIIGRISEPQVDGDDPTAHTDGPKGNDRPEGEGETDRLQRLAEFREQTRGQRMAIASAAQVRWRRTVSWGARCGDTDAIFTHVAAPVMTRLTFSERQVLDTLVDAGVAGSRSEALAWCVRQVSDHQTEWIGRLREAMSEVERIRAEGPSATG